MSTVNKLPRILILMHYMELGGAESALLGLLQSIDPAQVDVDLFIYSHRGELMSYIPTDKVHLLPEVEAYSLTEKPLAEVVRRGHFRLAWARWLGRRNAIRFARKHKQEHQPNESGTFFQQQQTWHVLPHIQPDVEYDLAISFLTPHFIVLNNVRAKKKVGWIHTDYTRIFIDAEAELPMWERLDHIVSISPEVEEKFCTVFPTLRPKLVLIENILSTTFIRRRAEEPLEQASDTRVDQLPDSQQSTVNSQQSTVNLLTIGRYSPQKRMEEIPRLCRKLRDAGHQVKWHIIGYGSQEVERTVHENIVREGVTDSVIMLGKQSNPYPYIKACDIYVQPSLYEGKSITVREAQILCKPVVITNYPTAPSQVLDGMDGVIVPMDIDACARQMSQFLSDVDKQQAIVRYLEQHDYGNEKEVEKIYQMVKSSPCCPKVIHYCWFGGKPLPKFALKCIRSWKKYFPDYEVKEWNESNFDVNMMPYTREAYAAKKYAFVSDVARFWILYREGGVYFDTDVEVIAPMDDILERGPFMGIEAMDVYEKGWPAIAPGLGLAVGKGHEFYRSMLTHYEHSHYCDAEGHPQSGTVVWHTTQMLKQAGLRPQATLQCVQGIWLYPSDYFCPLEDATGILRKTSNTRSIHWYSKTWNAKPMLYYRLTRILHRIFGVERLAKMKG